ncbi:MAG: thioredoxin-disulfide reductase [Armatimonadetes bacterium]|nr:thioredoxin-disulfide reductase [Armatimonadota bacterium]
MTECHECDVIIVGAGAAGLTAALYVQRYGLKGIVLEKLAPGGQLTSANLIENYPGFPEGISGYDLIDRFRRHAEAFGAQIETDTIERVEPHGDRWRLVGAKRDYLAQAVIIATGARHRHLNVPGEKEFAGRGISVCATCDGFFYRGKDVAVVGGGNVALDDAVYLADLAHKVTVVHRRDALRAEPVLQERAFARPNIEFAWDSVVVRINGTDAVQSVTIRNVKTDQERDIPVDGVFVAIGFVPEVALVQHLVETEDGHIITDGHMRTSAEGIFACGDIRQTALKQIATAVGDGAIAADSAYKYIQARR